MKELPIQISTKRYEDLSSLHLWRGIIRESGIFLFCISILFISSIFFILSACSEKKSSASNSSNKVEEDLASKKGAHERFLHPLWTNYQLNTSVLSMAFEEGYLWVGTERGLIKYDLLKDIIVEKYDAKALVSSAVTSIKIDSQGNRWIGTHGGGLTRLKDNKMERYSVPDLADPFVYDIVFDKDGLMWVANWKGVSVYDGKSWKSYLKEDGLIDDWVYAIAIDRDGVKWFGTEGGVTRFDGSTWKSYTHEDGLGATIEEIGGYQRIENPSHHHQTYEGKEAEGYNPNYILAADVDEDNNKWFGTWGAGLSRFDGKMWKNFTTKDGLPGNFISDIKIEDNGTIWIGTEGGVGYFDGKDWKRLSKKDGMIGDSVFSITIDDQKNKWFGTLEGISKLEGFAGM